MAILFGLLMFGVVGLHSQVADTLPISTKPPPRPDASGKKASVQTEGMFKELQDASTPQMRDAATENLFNENVRAIYRRPSSQEVAIMAPAKKWKEDYAQFLSQSNTGIFKLNADSRCGENPEVISVSDNCLRYKMPGAGTSFSFRFDGYRIPRLADLILEGDVLKSDGIMQQGIMVNLGDRPIDTIDLSTNGLQYLLEASSARNSNELARIKTELGSGIKANQFIYGLGFYAKPNTTFALRSIAYKSVFMRSLNGLAYDEFRFDKRKDVIVVFRVVERDSNGSLTIIWKELSIKDAPSLKSSTLATELVKKP